MFLGTTKYSITAMKNLNKLFKMKWLQSAHFSQLQVHLSLFLSLFFCLFANVFFYFLKPFPVADHFSTQPLGPGSTVFAHLLRVDSCLSAFPHTLLRHLNKVWSIKIIFCLWNDYDHKSFSFYWITSHLNLQNHYIKDSFFCKKHKNCIQVYSSFPAPVK